MVSAMLMGEARTLPDILRFLPALYIVKEYRRF
jgi:hypothetical protein